MRMTAAESDVVVIICYSGRCWTGGWTTTSLPPPWMCRLKKKMMMKNGKDAELAFLH